MFVVFKKKLIWFSLAVVAIFASAAVTSIVAVSCSEKKETVQPTPTPPPPPEEPSIPEEIPEPDFYPYTVAPFIEISDKVGTDTNMAENQILKLDYAKQKTQASTFIIGTIQTSTNSNTAFDVDNNQIRWNWGGDSNLAYNKQDNEQNASIKKQIIDFQAQGNNIILSFGVSNLYSVTDETKGTDFWNIPGITSTTLTNTYTNLNTTYNNVNHFNFELTNPTINRAGNELNAEALKDLQDVNRKLKINITLPVSVSGLSDATQDLLGIYLASGISINNMNLSFANIDDKWKQSGEDLGDTTIRITNLARDQIKQIFKTKQMVTFSDAQIYQKIGVTPTIGQHKGNNGEYLYTTDMYQKVVNFAMNKQIGLLSMWLLNRDLKNTDGYSGKFANNSGVAAAFDFSTVAKEAIFGTDVPPPPIKPDTLLSAIVKTHNVTATNALNSFANPDLTQVDDLTNLALYVNGISTLVPSTTITIGNRVVDDSTGSMSFTLTVDRYYMSNSETLGNKSFNISLTGFEKVIPKPDTKLTAMSGPFATITPEDALKSFASLDQTTVINKTNLANFVNGLDTLPSDANLTLTGIAFHNVNGTLKFNLLTNKYYLGNVLESKVLSFSINLSGFKTVAPDPIKPNTNITAKTGPFTLTSEAALKSFADEPFTVVNNTTNLAKYVDGLNTVPSGATISLTGTKPFFDNKKGTLIFTLQVNKYIDNNILIETGNKSFSISLNGFVVVIPKPDTLLTANTSSFTTITAEDALISFANDDYTLVDNTTNLAKYVDGLSTLPTGSVTMQISGTAPYFNNVTGTLNIILKVNPYYENDSLITNLTKSFTINLTKFKIVLPPDPTPEEKYVNTLAPFVDFTDYVGWNGDWASSGALKLIKIANKVGSHTLNLGFIEQALDNGGDDNDTGSAFGVVDNKAMWAWGSLEKLSPMKNDEIFISMQAQIRNFQAQGGKAIVSFGGAGQRPIWIIPSVTVENLENAYLDVIDRYQLTHIDIDAEGLGSAYATNVLNAKALKNVIAKTNVKVNLTLAVTPNGLDAFGLLVLKAYLENGVIIDTLNLMTMCYTADQVAPGDDFGDASIKAVDNSKNQLISYFKTYASQTLNDAQAYAKIGTTPSIGFENDMFPIYTLAMHEKVIAHAMNKQLNMLSMWCFNRDLLTMGAYENNKGIPSQFAFTNISKKAINALDPLPDVDPPTPEPDPEPPVGEQYVREVAPFIDFAGWMGANSEYSNNGVVKLDYVQKQTSTNKLNLGFIQAVKDDAQIQSNQIIWGWGQLVELSPFRNNPQFSAMGVEIGNFQRLGHEVTVSLGGLTGTAIWDIPGVTQAQLEYAYTDIINMYKLTEMDLDIEDSGMRPEQNKVNAAAIKNVMARTNVKINITLPVTPSGLISSGLDILKIYLEAGVDISLVNIMTMCYTADQVAPGDDFGDASIKAVDKTMEQLKSYYKTYANKTLTTEEAYAKIGTTPSIGFEGDNFPIYTEAMHEKVVTHAMSKRLGMLSMWVFQRDMYDLGGAYANNKGIKSRYAFTNISKKAIRKTTETKLSSDLNKELGSVEVDVDYNSIWKNPNVFKLEEIQYFQLDSI